MSTKLEHPHGRPTFLITKLRDYVAAVEGGRLKPFVLMTVEEVREIIAWLDTIGGEVELVYGMAFIKVYEGHVVDDGQPLYASLESRKRPLSAPDQNATQGTT